MMWQRVADGCLELVSYARSAGAVAVRACGRCLFPRARRARVAHLRAGAALRDPALTRGRGPRRGCEEVLGREVVWRSSGAREEAGGERMRGGAGVEFLRDSVRCWVGFCQGFGSHVD